MVLELSMVRDAYFAQGVRPELDTVFVGGGTPTMLSLSEWETLAQAVHEQFTLTPGAEWTCEANPGSADRDLLTGLHSFGVNRISFGAQTFNETLLQAIGRTHDAADVLHSVSAAQAAGFERINVDLMLGLPDQTIMDVDEALRRVQQAGVAHISAYGLKVEPGTPFAKWQSAGHLQLPSEEAEGDMYERLREVLANRGFDQYEISNFAQPGHDARHNMTYWRNQPYLAVGAGAHGYVFGQRYENIRGLDAYEQAIMKQQCRPLAQTSTVTASEAMEDTFMLGLRLAEGVTRKRFTSWHDASCDEMFAEVIGRLTARGWIADDGQRIFIPPAYYPIANDIFASFIGVLT